MNRRDFIGSCTLLSGIAPLAHADAGGEPAQVRRYTHSLLVDIHGQPIRQARIRDETNYVFQYPFAATPCFLLRLAAPVSPVPALRRERGGPYASPGGVGPARNLVAFSAICAHKLAYPTRDVSFIRYQRSRSPTSSGKVIHCCADHSVYDPAAGARVVAGPAPQPLAAILLEHDAASDQLTAVGTLGGEMFNEFFQKYAFRLQMEHGARAKETVQGPCVVQALENYCKQQVKC